LNGTGTVNSSALFTKEFETCLHESKLFLGFIGRSLGLLFYSAVVYEITGSSIVKKNKFLSI